MVLLRARTVCRIHIRPLHIEARKRTGLFAPHKRLYPPDRRKELILRQIIVERCKDCRLAMSEEKSGFLFRRIIKVSAASMYMDIHKAGPNIKPLRVDPLRLPRNLAAPRRSAQGDPAILDPKHAVPNNAVLQHELCVYDVLHTASLVQSLRSISRYRR